MSKMDFKNEASTFLSRIGMYFIDKKNHIIKRFFTLICIFIIAFVVDDFFGFTFNYKINSKISQIEQIESIKSSFSRNYSMSSELEKELDLIEKEVLEKEFILDKKNIEKVSSISNQFINRVKLNTDKDALKKDKIKEKISNLTLLLVYYISLHWIWVVVFLVMLVDVVRKPKTIMNDFLYQMFFLVFMIFIWHIFFNFIYRGFGIDTISGAIKFNIGIYLGLILIIASNSYERKKLSKNNNKIKQGKK